MIAISYRREDSLPIAGRLYDRLLAKFGKPSIFMDFDSIRPGLDFREQIKETIERCNLVVAVIGPHWVGQQVDASRRIDDPNDFVRLEIAYALKRDIPIIPVLVNNTPMPKPETLPPDIHGLVYRHALPLDSGIDFHQHADRVISGICNVVNMPAQSQAPPQKSDKKETAGARRPRNQLLVATALVLALAAALAVLFFVVLPKLERTSDLKRSGIANSNAPAAPIAPVPPAPSRSNTPTIELSSLPAGAKVLRNGVAIGTTPIRRDDLAPGLADFVLIADGYLPRELKATIDPQQGFKSEVSLAKPAPLYTGAVRVRDGAESPARPIAIALNSDLNSGTMTQSSTRGDFVVKFTGIWEATELHAVTGEVVTQSVGIRWAPESFVLRFSEDGKTASYECVADGKVYVADLSGQFGENLRASSIFKGIIRKQGQADSSGVPLTIAFSADRKSGTETQTSKYGDTIVKFNGVWEGTTLHAVTDAVVSKPNNIQWTPESFTLRFADDWRSALYHCNADGQRFTAQLSSP
jgi:hypothetical protein